MSRKTLKKKAAKRQKRVEKHARRAGTLHGVSEIRRFFRANETPITFVSGTGFDLLGVDRWVRRFEYVTYDDPFDGHHPHVFAPTRTGRLGSTSALEVCNHLLGHEQVVEHVCRRRGGGKAVVPALDEKTERLAAEAALELASVPAALRARLASATEQARLRDKAGIPAVPHVVGRASTYGVLQALSVSAGLGHDLVVQVADDPARRTFVVSSESDWQTHADRLAGQALEVMKRIDGRAVAIAGVVTRHGTLLGALPAGLSEEQRRQARRCVGLIGERLRQEGYRGSFELELLADLDTGATYLGTLEPSLAGANSPTHLYAVASGEMPLFLFHLLEFMEVEYELDVDALNARMAARDTDEWSRLVLENPDTTGPIAGAPPPTGVWRLDPAAPAGIRFVRRETDWRSVGDEDEAFFLRGAGAELGILVARGNLRTDDGEPTERGRAWIDGIEQFETGFLPAPAQIR